LTALGRGQECPRYAPGLRRLRYARGLRRLRYARGLRRLRYARGLRRLLGLVKSLRPNARPPDREIQPRLRGSRPDFGDSRAVCHRPKSFPFPTVQEERVGECRK
jgi:hypothetical protein